MGRQRDPERAQLWFLFAEAAVATNKIPKSEANSRDLNP